MSAPNISSLRRTKALRALAVAQMATNDTLAKFLARGFWARLAWLLLGR